MARSIFLGLYRANLLILASIGLAATLAVGCEYSSPRRAISASAMSAGNDIVPPRWAQRVYESNCAVCHGLQGDGNGPAAGMFLSRPRDFRSGIFKFRSTPSGSLPTDEDLFWTITHGLRWTGMIARPDLSKTELQAVVQQLKSFSPRFTRDKPAGSVNVARQPPRTSVLVEQGKKMFRDADCVSCHGEQGRGDERSAADMRDDWGSPIRPGDLTWRPLKRGSSLQAIYLTIVTGLSGTPMPAYGDSLSPDDVWAIVYYLESLVPIERRLSPARLLGEERQGQMALHMGAMMGLRH